MKNPLPAVGLAAAISLGAAWTAPAAVGAASVPAVHSRVGSRVATVPEPGQGWLTGRRQRLLAVWLLLDAAGLLWWYGAAPQRPPKLLGSVGAHRAPVSRPEEPDPSVRGIGRFARPRSAPPNRL